MRTLKHILILMKYLVIGQIILKKELETGSREPQLTRATLEVELLKLAPTILVTLVLFHG